MGAEPIFFQARNISRTFGPVRALNEVTVTLNRGEVHAIIGENGAGKSTLMNIICGKLRPSAGELLLEGKVVQFHSPKDAQTHGIAIAPQEINLVPHLSVMENILLGAHCGRSWLIDWKRTKQTAAHYLHEIDETIHPKKRVVDLSKAQQQLVQIARAAAAQAQIIIFDEPTAALTYREEEKLMAFISKLAKDGCSAFYISHRLEEIRRLSHRITVLRDGNLIDVLTPEKATYERMVTMMAGRPLKASAQPLRTMKADQDIILEVKDLVREREFDKISFGLRKGEILGVCGLIGSGRTELAKCIFGLTKAHSGKVVFAGKEVRFTHPAQAIAAGLIYLPEERKQEGIFPLLSIAENTALPTIKKFAGWLTISNRQIFATVGALAQQVKAKFHTLKEPITLLSGGNQQKFILARWLMRDAKVLIMDEPTRGIDVNAKVEIQTLLRKLTEERGLSLLLISSEMEELLNVADRIMVMHEGKLKGIVERAGATPASLLKLAMG